MHIYIYILINLISNGEFICDMNMQSFQWPIGEKNRANDRH